MRIQFSLLDIAKEGSVCWYDGLSCKLNSIAIEGSIPFLPNILLIGLKVEHNTSNITV